MSSARPEESALPDKTTADSGGQAAPAAPDDAQQLRDEIERTREHLGDTVEQLASKLDVKSRARAEAAQVAGQVKGAAAQVPAQVKSAAEKVRGLLSGSGAGAHAANARQQAASAGQTGKDKLRRGQEKLGQVTPDPVRQAFTKGTSAARKNPLPFAAAVAALIAVFLTIWQRRKR